ncbi:MAG: transcriptional regulator [Rickettsiales bacterium]|jgi:transcriptional regulator with XRE-family HTH domain|nr:transcriptional regulator [Rickettsiales bacterium]
MAYEEIIFPNNIRKIRMSQGMKMTELAKRAGLSLSAMSKVETGVRRLNQKQMMTLCQILNAKLSALFIRDNDMAADEWRADMNRRLAQNEGAGLKIFGAGVRQIRKAAGKTITNAARDAGMTLSVYHKIEVGQRDVYADEIDNLAKSFGLTRENLFKKIADMYKSGKLETPIKQIEAKVRSVIDPSKSEYGDGGKGAIFGADIYNSARKKLVPVFVTPQGDGAQFKKSDEKMMMAPMGLAGRRGVYAILPNTKRLGEMFPENCYMFADSEASASAGDLAVIVETPFDKIAPDVSVPAYIVILDRDSHGNLIGVMQNPTEKIQIKSKSCLNKIVQVIFE